MRLPTPPTNEKYLVGRIVGKYHLEQESETMKALGVSSSNHENMTRYGGVLKIHDSDADSAAISSPTKVRTKSPKGGLLADGDQPLTREQIKQMVEATEKRERARRKKKTNASGRQSIALNDGIGSDHADSRRKVSGSRRTLLPRRGSARSIQP